MRAVAGRTKVERYATAYEPGASVDLIRTGRSVAGCLDVGLNSERGIVTGYVRAGALAEHARRFGMRADYEGEHLLFEYTLPVPLNARRMPDAVVAVDLARSLDPDERAKGLEALERIRQSWLPADPVTSNRRPIDAT